MKFYKRKYVHFSSFKKKVFKCHGFFCSHTLPLTLFLPVPLILSGTIRSPYRHSRATFHHKWHRFKCTISIHRPDRCSRPERCRENLCGTVQPNNGCRNLNLLFQHKFILFTFIWGTRSILGASTNILAAFTIKEVHRDHLHLPPYLATDINLSLIQIKSQWLIHMQ